MPEIKIERLSDHQIEELGVHSWPIWEKEVSTFTWHYDEAERCLVLEGHVRVEPEEGDPVEFGAGDFVHFPAGMSCTWTITAAVRKHYSFG